MIFTCTITSIFQIPGDRTDYGVFILSHWFQDSSLEVCICGFNHLKWLSLKWLLSANLQKKMARQKSAALPRILHLAIVSFCLSKSLPLYIAKTALCFVIMIIFYDFFLLETEKQPLPIHTHTFPLWLEWKKIKHILYLLWTYSQPRVHSQHEGSVKRKIHFEYRRNACIKC